MKGLNLAGVDNAQVVQLRIIKVLEKSEALLIVVQHNTNMTTTTMKKYIVNQTKYFQYKCNTLNRVRFS